MYYWITPIQIRHVSGFIWFYWCIFIKLSTQKMENPQSFCWSSVKSLPGQTSRLLSHSWPLTCEAQSDVCWLTCWKWLLPDGGNSATPRPSLSVFLRFLLVPPTRAPGPTTWPNLVFSFICKVTNFWKKKEKKDYIYLQCKALIFTDKMWTLWFIEAICSVEGLNKEL